MNSCKYNILSVKMKYSHKEQLKYCTLSFHENYCPNLILVNKI